MLPIGDEPNSRQFPIINYLLIVINALIFIFITLPLFHKGIDFSDPLIQQAFDALREANPDVSVTDLRIYFQRQVDPYVLFIREYGFIAQEPRLLTLFSAMFLHSGWAHFAGNMLILWIYGDNVEARLGHLRYLFAYLAMGILATLTFGAIERLSGAAPVPMVGASGAISGVLGYYFLMFPRNRVKVLLFFFPIIMDIVRLPARLVIGFYIIADNLVPMLFGSESNVAYGAHLGGIASGILLAMAHRKLSKNPWGLKGEAPSRISELDRAISSREAARSFQIYESMDPDSRARLSAQSYENLATLLRDSWPAEAFAVVEEFIRGFHLHPQRPAFLLAAIVIALQDLRRPDLAQPYLDELGRHPIPPEFRATLMRLGIRL